MRRVWAPLLALVLVACAPRARLTVRPGIDPAPGVIIDGGPRDMAVCRAPDAASWLLLAKAIGIAHSTGEGVAELGDCLVHLQSQEREWRVRVQHSGGEANVRVPADAMAALTTAAIGIARAVPHPSGPDAPAVAQLAQKLGIDESMTLIRQLVEDAEIQASLSEGQLDCIEKLLLPDADLAREAAAAAAARCLGR